MKEEEKNIEGFIEISLVALKVEVEVEAGVEVEAKVIIRT